MKLTLILFTWLLLHFQSWTEMWRFIMSLPENERKTGCIFAEDPGRKGYKYMYYKNDEVGR